MLATLTCGGLSKLTEQVISSKPLVSNSANESTRADIFCFPLPFLFFLSYAPVDLNVHGMLTEAIGTDMQKM